MSADMIVPGAGFDPQMLNRFAYVRNNPLRYVDPSGHSYDSWGPGGEIDFGEKDKDFENNTKEWDDKGKQEKDWEYLTDEKRSATWKIKHGVPYDVEDSYKIDSVNGGFVVVQNCIGYDGKSFIKTTIVNVKDQSSIEKIFKPTDFSGPVDPEVKAFLDSLSPSSQLNQLEQDLIALKNANLSDVGPQAFTAAGVSLVITGSELTVKGVGIMSGGGPTGWVGGGVVTVTGLTATGVGGWAVYKGWQLAK